MTLLHLQACPDHSSSGFNISRHQVPKPSLMHTLIPLTHDLKHHTRRACQHHWVQKSRLRMTSHVLPHHISCLVQHMYTVIAYIRENNNKTYVQEITHTSQCNIALKAKTKRADINRNAQISNRNRWRALKSKVLLSLDRIKAAEEEENATQQTLQPFLHHYYCIQNIHEIGETSGSN